MLQDALVEKEFYEAREKARTQIMGALNGVGLEDELDERGVGGPPEIRYDDDGKPRPARMEYDDDRSDGPPAYRANQRDPRALQPETVPSDDYTNPFPMLDPPLGSI